LATYKLASGNLPITRISFYKLLFQTVRKKISVLFCKLKLIRPKMDRKIYFIFILE
jgi:hypothetical protein